MSTMDYRFPDVILIRTKVVQEHHFTGMIRDYNDNLNNKYLINIFNAGIFHSLC